MNGLGTVNKPKPPYKSQTYNATKLKRHEQKIIGNDLLEILPAYKTPLEPKPRCRIRVGRVNSMFDVFILKG